MSAALVAVAALWGGPAAAQLDGTETLTQPISGTLNNLSFFHDTYAASSFNDSSGSGTCGGTGACIGVNISGTFGFDVQTTTGVSTANYSFTPDVGFSLMNAANTSAATTIVSSNGQPTTFTLNISSSTPTASFSSPSGQGPSLGLSVGLLTAASASIYGEVCVLGGCVGDSSSSPDVLFNYNDATHGTSATSPGDALPIISYNNGTLTLFGKVNTPLPNGIALSPANLTYLPLAAPSAEFSLGPLGVQSVGPAIQLGNIEINPKLTTVTGTASNTIESTQANFFSINADLLGDLSAALGLPVNPFQPQLNIGPIHVLGNLLSVYQGLSLGVTDTMSLTPNVGVSLQTNTPVTWTEETSQGVVVQQSSGATTNFTPVSLSDQIKITTTSTSDVVLLPTVTTTGTISDSLSESLNGNLQINGPDLEVSAYHVPLWNSGSLFSYTYDEGSIAQLGTSESQSQTVSLAGLAGASISYAPTLTVAAAANTTSSQQLLGPVNIQPVAGALQLLSGSDAQNQGTLTIQSGDPIELDTPASGSHTLLTTPALTVAAAAGGNPAGSLSVDSGAVLTVTDTTTATDGFTNTYGGTLQNGSYTIAGTLNYTGSNITSIGANTSLTLSGTGALLNNGQNALTGLGSNSGTLALTNNATLTDTGGLFNYGTLQVTSGTLTVTQLQNVSGSSIQIGSAGGGQGILDVTGSGLFYNLSGGTLSGGSYDIESGTLVSAGSNISTIAAGTSVTLGGPQTGYYFATEAGSSNPNNFSKDQLTYLTNNSGTLTLQNGAQQYLFVSGNSENLSTVYGSGNTVQTFTNNGTLNILPGTNSSNPGCGSSQSCLYVSGNVVNASGATMTINGGALNVALVDQNATGTVNFTNSGTLVLSNQIVNGETVTGTLTVSGTLAAVNGSGGFTSCNDNGCTLSGGNWNIAGNLSWDTSYEGNNEVIAKIGSGTTFTLAGGTISGGLESLTENDGTLNIEYETVGLTGTAQFLTNKGTLTLTGPGGGLVTSGSLNNTTAGASITVGQSANLYVGLIPNSDDPSAPTSLGHWTSYGNGTLSNIGTITVTGQLDYSGTGVITTLGSGSNLTLDGSNSAPRLVYYNCANGAGNTCSSGDALAGHLQTVASGATLGLTNGYTFEASTSLAFQSGSTLNTDAASTLLVNDGKTLTINQGTTVNNAGTIALNGTSAGATLAIAGSGTVTLGGMISLSNNANNAINIGANATLVNNGTIGGAGSITGGVTNNGTIEATGSNALTISFNTLLNNGTLASIGSGSQTTYADGTPVNINASTGAFECETPVSSSTCTSTTGNGTPTNLVTTSVPSTLILNGSYLQNSPTATISVQSNVVLLNTLLDNGTINVGGAAAATGGGSLTGSGGATLTLNNASYGDGTLNNYAGGLITTVASTNNDLGGTINNSAGADIQVVAGSTLTINAGASFTNNGLIDLQPGSSAATLACATTGIANCSSWSFTNAGTIQAVAAAGNVSISTPIVNTSTGLLAVDNGAIVSYTGNLSNAGQITVGAQNGANGVDSSASQLNVSGTITQSGGATTVTAGSLSFGSFALNGGTLTLQSTNDATGAVTVNGGTFALGANQSLGAALTLESGSITVGDDAAGNTVAGALTATSFIMESGTVSTVLAGTGALTMQGPGTVVLSFNNTYSGGTTITGGTLQLGTNNALLTTGAVAVNGGTFGLNGFNQTVGDLSGTGGTVALGGATLTEGTSNSTTLASQITGSGTLTKQGSGTLTLSNSSNSGAAFGTTVNAGTVAISAAGDLGTGTLTLNGGTLSVTSGSFTLGDGVTVGSSGGTVATSTGVVLTLSQSIAAGSDLFTKTGAGTLALAGANTLSDAAINGGVLQISAADNLISAGGILSFGGGTLEVTSGSFALSEAVTLNTSTDTIQTDTGVALSQAQAIGGTGTLNKTGAGTLTLSLANPYSGGTAIDGGVLAFSNANQLGNGGTIGFGGGTLSYTPTSGSASLGHAVALNSGGGTIETGSSDTLTLNDAISGTGGLTIAGSGTVALANGITLPATALTVNSGTFRLGTTNQTAVGAVTVAGGTISSAGGTLAGTSFTLDSGTVSAVLAGTGALTMAGPGTAILSAANTYTGGTTVTAGTLQLGVANALPTTGAVAVNGGELNVSNQTQTVGDLSGTGGTVALGTGTLTEGTSNSTTLAAEVTGSGTLVKQGSGTLTLSNSSNSGAAFGTTVNAGTVAISAAGDLGTGTLTLNNGTLTVTGAMTLANAVSLGSGGGTFNNSAALALNGAITGTGGLTQSGSSTTTLGSTSNSYSGGTTVSAGTLALGASGVLLSTGAVSVTGGTFNVNGFTQTVGDLSGTAGTVALGTGTLTEGTSDSTSLASKVTGSGTLTKQGTGTLTLSNSGNSGATFATTVNGGAISIAAAGDLGTGTLTLNNGTLTVTSATTLSNAVLLGSSGGTLNNSAALTLNGAITGSGSLTQSGSSTATLSHAGDSYTGGTTITAGALDVGATNALPITGAVAVNGGTFGLNGFNQTVGDLSGTGGTVALGSNTLTEGTGNSTSLASQITGTGTLMKQGSGSLTLTDTSNSGAGFATDVTAGTVSIGAAGDLGTGTLTLNNGALAVTGATTLGNAVSLGSGGGKLINSAALMLNGAITGTGGLTQAGTSASVTTTLVNTSNTYSGGTSIDGGVLAFNNAGQLGSGGTIGFGGGTLSDTATSGSISLGHGVTLNTGGGTIQAGGGATLTLNDAITGTGGLTIAGSGTVALSTGVTLPATALTVNSGTFNLGTTNQSAGAVTVAGGTISSAGGTLTGTSFTLDSGTVSAVLTGGSALTMAGPGTAILSAANTYIGGTTVNAGTLQLGVTNALPTTGAVVVNGGELNVSNQTQTVGDLSGTGGTVALGTGTLTEGTSNSTALASQITGSGKLAKQGSGTLTLSDTSNGSATFATTVNAGAVSIGAAGDLGTGTLTLNGGTLAVTGAAMLSNAVSLGGTGGTFNNSAALALNGAITGTGGLTQSGSSTTTLGSTSNSYSGGTIVSAGTLTLGASGVLLSTGAVAVNGGELNVNGQTQTVGDLSGTGGTVALGGGTLTEGTANSTTLASQITGTGTLVKTGTGTLTLGGNDAGQGFGTTVNQGTMLFSGNGALGGGAVSVGANGTVNVGSTTQSASSVSDSGAVTVGGGQLNGAVTINSGGQFSGYGTLNGAVNNSGTLMASGGTLRVTGAISDPNGAVTVASNSTLDLSGSSGASQATVLTQNGTLILNSSGITVSQDYTNANFGSGNSFNKAANVSGGPIDATGNVAQAIVAGTGTAAGQVQNGSSSTVTLALGNIHVGSSETVNYQIANTGSSGPDLRGAVQTSVNGGNITDSRLSGTGVSAASSFGLTTGDLGPIATGSSTGNLSVTFTGTTAGALSGQAVHIANNFANVGEQTLDITGAAYRLATAQVSPGTLSLGNVHVGGTASGALGVANTAVADGYSESLGITSVSASGTGFGATNELGGNLIAAGGDDASAVGVTLSNVQAGAHSGSVTVDLDSDGTGTSGLGTTALASQTVDVTATGYRLASAQLNPAPLSLGNFHVGATANGSISVANTATADGYSESLGITSVSASGAGLNATNALGNGLIAAGATDAAAVGVTLGNVQAGVQNDSVTVNLNSNGAGTSGLGKTSLASQNVDVTATGYRLATTNLTSQTVNFGAARVGGSALTQNVTYANTQTADGYSEGLAVTQGALPSGYSGNVGVANLAAGQQTTGTLSLQTATSGDFTGKLSVGIASTGATTSGLGDTTLGSASLTLNGKVYQTAQASTTSNVNFGIVHRNSTEPTQAVTVTNTATGALVDEIQGGFGTVTGPFAGSGTLAGVAGNNGSNSSSLLVTMQTSNVGSYTGSAQLALTSHDSDLADVSLSTADVSLQGQVNDYAKPVLSEATGAAVFTGSGDNYSLNFGDVLHQDDSAQIALNNALSFLDSVAAYTDSLAGSFSVASGSGFEFSGLGAISTVAADGPADLFSIDLDAQTLPNDFYREVLEFDPLSSNASNTTPLAPVFLTLTANVSDSLTSNVPEPGTGPLMAMGLLGLGAVRTAGRVGWRSAPRRTTTRRRPAARRQAA